MAKIQRNPLFREGVELAFLGYPLDVGMIPREKKSKKPDFDLHPLPYYSPCEDPRKYSKEASEILWLTEEEREESYQAVLQDARTREFLLKKARSPDDLAYWCFLHCCSEQAAFITYAMVRLLFPTLKVHLVYNLRHTVLMNEEETLVFDPITQELEEGPEWWRGGDEEATRLRRISEDEILEWLRLHVNEHYTKEEMQRIREWRAKFGKM